jgi:hypothetical protein
MRNADKACSTQARAIGLPPLFYFYFYLAFSQEIVTYGTVQRQVDKAR